MENNIQPLFKILWSYKISYLNKLNILNFILLCLLALRFESFAPVALLCFTFQYQNQTTFFLKIEKKNQNSKIEGFHKNNFKDQNFVVFFSIYFQWKKIKV